MLHARTLLDRKNQSFGDVINVLTGLSKLLTKVLIWTDEAEFKDNIGEGPAKDGETGKERNVQVMILEQLIAFLEGLE